MRLSTRWGIRRPVIIVAVVAIAVVCTALASAGRDPGRPVRTILPAGFGHFAGYMWSGSVRTVQASFRVPAPGRPVRGGGAATWIAAQARKWSAPFIQVGVLEQARWDPHGTESGDWAVWSDTAHHYRPIALFRVRPGDRVAVGLAQARGRWSVSISDAQAGREASFGTREAGLTGMRLAEWAQEDPGGERAVPYQPTSPITFTHVLVNGHVPHSSDPTRLWMSTSDGPLGPGPLRGDQFVIGPRHESAAARRYLKVVDPFNAAQFTFAAHLASWTHATLATEVKAAWVPLLRAEATFAAALRTGQWPADARGEIGELAGAADTLAALMRGVRDSAVTVRAAWAAWVEADGASNARHAQKLRSKLGLPSLEHYRSAGAPPGRG